MVDLKELPPPVIEETTWAEIEEYASKHLINHRWSWVELFVRYNGARLLNEGAEIVSQRNFSKHLGIAEPTLSRYIYKAGWKQSVESKRVHGRKAGLNTKERGTGIFSLTPDELQDARSKGGQAIALLSQTVLREKFRETGSKGAALGNHRRWHVNRNIVNESCSLCRAAGEGGSNA